MISEKEFISQSLELNLFFLRIMKEHSIFLEATFVVKDKNLISQAHDFKRQFTNLLYYAISLSEGVISSSVLESNSIVTKYTMDAEKATESASGIYIDSSITSLENSLSPGTPIGNITYLTDQVYRLNQYSIASAKMIAEFKTKLLRNVLSCITFTNTYPLLIDHILREALFFAQLLTKLQNGIEFDVNKDIIEQESFGNRIMSEHSFFIRGLLDPTETELFEVLNNFGKEFEELRQEASSISKSQADLALLTSRTLESTKKLSNFKSQATEGLLTCNIKAIILPLLADHVLREANHYISQLENYDKISFV